MPMKVIVQILLYIQVLFTKNSHTFTFFRVNMNI